MRRCQLRIETARNRRFFVNDFEHHCGGIADEGEDIEVLELPFAEALAMMQDGRICDAKTIILLQYAQLNLFGSEKT